MIFLRLISQGGFMIKMNFFNRMAVMCGLVCVMVAFANGQTRRPVLEYCTGTWCQYCPCGHDIIRNTILPNIPDAIIISYHGPANTSSDPYSTFSGNAIISALGFSSYPTGVIDRTTAPLGRGSWYSTMFNRWNVFPRVALRVEHEYSSSTREFNATITARALFNLTGQYRITLLLLEDGLVYPQTGNISEGCIGGSDYIHNHVVRTMINGYLGDVLSVPSPWPVGDSVSVSFQYIVPTTYVAENCKLVAFVYKVESSLNTSQIQQAEEWPLTGPTSVGGQWETPQTFALFQNYPNPFNPATTISYQLGSQAYVSLRIYNLLGEEVRELVANMQEPGTYPIEWDGTGNNGRALPSGIYTYQLTAGSYRETRKMILLK
jgi:hypothetical protein